MSSRHEIKIPVHWNFESLDEMVDYINTTPWDSVHDSSRSTGRQAFNATDSLDHALKLAKDGWPEGTKRIHDLENKLNISNLRSAIGDAEVEVYDTAGAFVDVGLYLDGEPECMGEFEEVRAKNPRVVTIYINVAVSGGTFTDKVMRKGAAAGALVDLLESAGISTEVVAIEMSNWIPTAATYTAADTNGRGKCYIVRTVVKRAGETLDLDRLAFALVHPAYLRRLVFAVNEKDNATPYGYGQPLSLQQRDLKNEDDLVIETKNVFGDSVWSTEASTLQWLKKQLTKYIPNLDVEEGH